MVNVTLEERVAALETELAELKRRLGSETSQDGVPWWKKIVGIFEGDPEFDEAMRLGREYRESLRPKEEDPTGETA